MGWDGRRAANFGCPAVTAADSGLLVGNGRRIVNGPGQNLDIKAS